MKERFYKKLLSKCIDIVPSIDKKHKHISFIIYRDTIVSIGINNNKTSTKSFHLGYRYSDMHSELDAWIKVPKNMRNLDLNICNFRMNNSEQLRDSKPCKICTSWCCALFDKVYYTDRNGLCLLNKSIITPNEKMLEIVTS